MFKKTLAVVLLATVSIGCATSSQVPGQAHEMLIATPKQAGIEQQAAIAKLTEVISHTEKQDEHLANLYYDRGVRYDTLGLKALAHFDFSRAIRMKPDFADAYNFLGIHYTLGEQYIEAFEAFGSALELKPEHNFALLNRGIARYYAGRSELAVEDLQEFLSLKPHDPYRVLWLYLAEFQSDPQKAYVSLSQNRQQLSQQEWGTHIVDLYLGRSSVTEFLNTIPVGLTNEAGYAERLCEAYFYMGKLAVMFERPIQARNYFRLAIATNVHDFVEHRYALLELKRLMNSGRTY